MIRKIVIVVIAIILSGCGTYATGPLFNEAPSPSEGKGILYVYRTDTYFIPTPLVKIDNSPLVKLAKLGYSYAYLSPGVHRLTMEYAWPESPSIIEFQIKAGQELFIRYEDTGGRRHLTELTKTEAINEIKTFKYVAPLNDQF